MKHIFIINPCAGREDSTSSISQQVEAYASAHPAFDHQIYVTQSPGDATQWVSQWCSRHPGREARFYACGGDGTLNEVVSGLIGQPAVQVTCYASGSGNDYIKYYGTLEDFNDLERLVNGQPHPVDVMKVNNRYSINICNFGFDAMVCKIGNDVRRKPIIGGKHSYTTGIIRSIFTSRSNYVRMTVDGEPFFDGHMLLCTLGNGRYNGGKYMCAPLSKNDDGLLEVNLFKRMSLLKFASLIDDYSHGTHINRPEVKRLMLYRQATTVEMASPDPFWLVIDGEMLHSNRYRVVNLRHAVTFVSPHPLSHQN
ncbi:MAG: YegS/Rv2252/BmrU family lipid kinase [Bacteroidales bacterium]|nr:YegS/Rv2252/BmrU family lipid kinase [Bacteroidales bacterium]